MSIEPQSQSWDVIVVGAGVHGSSAAYHLAKSGQKTLLVDQFPLPHSRGSSAGHSRIARVVHTSKLSLTPILVDSLKQWRQIEAEYGKTLFRPTEMVAVSSPSCVNDGIATVESIRATLGVVETPSIKEINRHYSLNIPSDYTSCIDPLAGVLLADKCLSALHILFQRNGGEILDEWRIDDIETAGSHVTLRGARGALTARSLVLCPGPWAGPCLEKLGVNLPIRVAKIPVYYWRIKTPNVPPFVYFDTYNGYYYLPPIEYPGYAKLCPHDGPTIRPDERDAVDTSNIKQEVTQYVTDHFTHLHPETSIEESCMYTMTPDREFILDRHPLYPNIVYACGFSGSGFKIAPSVGAAIAQMVAGKPTELDWKCFSAERFNTRDTGSKL